MDDEKSQEVDIDDGKINIVNLINVMSDAIIGSQEGKKVERKMAVAVFVEKYQKMLEVTSFEDHIPFFMPWYEKMRDLILDTLEDDNWIAEGKIIVWFGNDIPKIKKQNIKLPISAIYKIALSVAKSIDESEDPNNPDQFLHDEILYYTLQVFKHCVISDGKYSDDVEELDKIIDFVGEDIGIVEKREPRKEGRPAMGGFLSGIKELMKSTGMTGPDGKPIADSIPDGGDGDGISEVLTGIFSNEKLTKGISDSMTKLNEKVAASDPSNMGETMSDVFATVGPTLAETIGDVMTKVPPPGVTDNGRKGTEQERAAEREQIQKSVKSMTDAITGVASSKEIQTIVDKMGKEEE